jgi:predicted GNAT family acetyltransferase
MTSTSSADADIQVRENVPERRFEIWVGDTLAGFSQYSPRNESTYTFTHTEIDPAFEGQGLASTLIRGSLDAMTERGIKVRPNCPFVRRFIQRHPDYQHLVPESEREHFGLPADRSA